MELMMVYNAKSGLKNAVLDSLHKMLSPSTYQCDLCALTYGNFTEKAVWKEFKEKSKFEIRFYHIDEFEAKFGKQNYIYPVALRYDNQSFETVISHQAFKTFKNTEELITHVKCIINDYA
ncbi:GTPase [Paucihalobacter ruber]|nr:GTPase [Paucihalobacter ruber]